MSSINKELKKFLNDNFPAICEARETDGKAWEDAIANIIINQDKYISTQKELIDELTGKVYQYEQMAEGNKENPDATKNA